MHVLKSLAEYSVAGKKNADCLNLLIRIHFHGIPENYLKREGIELVVKAPTLDPEFLS